MRVLAVMHTGACTSGLGFGNQGGTLDAGGRLFVNGCPWAHAVDAVARLLERPSDALLTRDEIDALDRRRVLHGVVID